MTTAVQKLEDGTINLTITIPNALIKKTFEEELNEAVKTADLPGFRKGKAPKKLVEEKIDKNKIQEKILQKLIPQAYIEAVKEHDLKPVLNPKIHIAPNQIGVEKIDKGEDWQFTAVTCEAPEVNLNAYKEAIQKLTAKSKIIVPGKEQEKPKFFKK
ncbi:MAG: trigger factor family protein, partial [Patescibacteria group bacterium]|nr:trigger factor family protein [Patescibacteria group bacterium]